MVLAPAKSYAASVDGAYPGDLQVATMAGTDVASATPITLNQATKGVLYDNDNEHWYEIVLPKAGKFQIVVGGEYSSDGGNWHVELSDSANSSLWDGYHSSDSIVSETLLTMGLPAGTYYISVTGGWSVEELEYSLTPKFEASSSWETERNDDVVHADPVGLGKAVRGTITENGDEGDWYKVSLPKAGKFRVAFSVQDASPDGNSWDFELRSSSNALICDSFHTINTKSAHAVITRSLKAGTYYVNVHGGWSATGKVYVLRPLLVKANPMKVSAKPAKVSYAKLKRSGRSISPVKASNAKGRVSFKKLSGNAKIRVNSKTGKFTIKKGLRKGRYAIAVKVTAKGNMQYASKSKKVKVRVVVR